MHRELYATRVVVRLHHIRANLEAIRAHIGPEPKILIAVKANGYGHGAVSVSRMAQRAGLADWLGIARVPEAIELREAGITLPILKFSHPLTEDEFDACLVHGVSFTVPDEATALGAIAASARTGQAARVHVKVETGMNRIGARPDEVVRLARLLDDADGVVLEGALTHLPVSDSPAQDGFTDDQIERFYDAVVQIEEAIGRPLGLVHCANSGAVLAHPTAVGAGRIPPERTMVRPGIIVYGTYPDPTTPQTIPLRPAMEWHTRVSFVKQVRAGESVGYGRTWMAQRDTWIATMPVGYADGYSRLLSNRGRVLVDGVSYPIVGRVCMDQTMIDIGPTPTVAVGDDVVLMGPSGDDEITCDELAELMGTITYEVTCLIPPHVGRVDVGG